MCGFTLPPPVPGKVVPHEESLPPEPKQPLPNATKAEEPNAGNCPQCNRILRRVGGGPPTFCDFCGMDLRPSTTGSSGKPDAKVDRPEPRRTSVAGQFDSLSPVDGGPMVNIDRSSTTFNVPAGANAEHLRAVLEAATPGTASGETGVNIDRSKTEINVVQNLGTARFRISGAKFGRAGELLPAYPGELTEQENGVVCKQLPLDFTAEKAGSINNFLRNNRLTPNPPKDTDGRREDSGRVGEGATGEMAGLHWGRLEVGGRSSVAA